MGRQDDAGGVHRRIRLADDQDRVRRILEGEPVGGAERGRVGEGRVAGEELELAAPGEIKAAGLSEFLVRDTPVAYAFIGPAFFLLLFLVAYPFALSLWFSLSDARVGETGNFIGLDNFARLLRSSIFLQTLQNSMVFTAAALTLKTVLGMALALLLFRLVRFKRLIRGAPRSGATWAPTRCTAGWPGRAGR